MATNFREKLGLYEIERAYAAFCSDNAQLWLDALGELARFAISESGDAGFHVLTREGCCFLIVNSGAE